MNTTHTGAERFLGYETDASTAKHDRWRHFWDSLIRVVVAVGGVSVIIAIVLIFFYLLYVVFPLFVPASMHAKQHYLAPGIDTSAPDVLDVEEQNEIGFRLTHSGQTVFFKTASGQIINEVSLPIPPATKVTAVAVSDPVQGVVVYGLSNGQALVAKQRYKTSYPNDKRLITPSLIFPYGKQPLVIDQHGYSLLRLAVQDSDEGLTIVAATGPHKVVIAGFSKQESMLDDGVTLERSQSTIHLSDAEVDYLLLSQNQSHLYIASRNGQLSHYDIRDKRTAKLFQRLSVVKKGLTLTALKFLTGDISLLVGDSSGRVTQWFSVFNQQRKPVLTPIRHFQLGDAPITVINAEQRRKGFVAADSTGLIGLFHTTAQRRLLTLKVSSSAITQAVLSPRANALMVQDRTGLLQIYDVDNEHPEISWSSLWSKVWYETYPKPAFIWQSSSADNDFEPKLSLTPLVFGTFKAAFYAMLFAVPIAILAAIYTSYFMAPRLRRVVKPSIETMEALPTVILGFLAGLWLAPLIEHHLSAIFSVLLIVPAGVLLFAYVWHTLPHQLRIMAPEGYSALVLVPVVFLLVWLSFAMSLPLETWLFHGDMRHWLETSLGIDFDQRNSIVVGIAMGFTVIPTIFSITEDAIFSVPKHLTFGSLALGATFWQTLTRVVLLTASPGIFSAVMIGLGRAVGETMIVLMAAGNTPVMNMNMFDGMRTLAANIAVEMPESEVFSTHYRVLFLAALVLFSFTFFVNTIAEVVRQHLRMKYSAL